MGRVFYKCVRPQGEQCSFFAWADEPQRANAAVPNGVAGFGQGQGGPSAVGFGQSAGGLGSGSAGAGGPSAVGFGQSAGGFGSGTGAGAGGGADASVLEGPPCTCGQPSAQRTTRKEGPNCGRVFFCCGRAQAAQCTAHDGE